MSCVHVVSPEVVKNEPYGEKADIWALGCILYQMATLQPPFYSSNMLSLASKVVWTHKRLLVFLPLVIDLFLSSCADRLSKPSMSQLKKEPSQRESQTWSDGETSVPAENQSYVLLLITNSFINSLYQVFESRCRSAAGHCSCQLQDLWPHDEPHGWTLHFPECTGTKSWERQEAGAEVLPGKTQKQDELLSL